MPRESVSSYRMLIDLNCDMGEETGNDQALMPWIRSANICCGYHAGNLLVTEQTILLASSHGVGVGAHPSFDDRENFGRKEVDCTYEEIYYLVTKQLEEFITIAAKHAIRVQHVKPHGALYNMAARDRMVASAFVSAVSGIDKNLEVYALSGSVLIHVAAEAGLKTRHEVFADRSYMSDGSLTSRTQSNALITDENMALEQVKQLISSGTVTTVDGLIIPLLAETICIHSDGSNAVQTAERIARYLRAGST